MLSNSNTTAKNQLESSSSKALLRSTLKRKKRSLRFFYTFARTILSLKAENMKAWRLQDRNRNTPTLPPATTRIKTKCQTTRTLLKKVPTNKTSTRTSSLEFLTTLTTPERPRLFQTNELRTHFHPIGIDRII